MALDVPDHGEQVLLAERRGDWTSVLAGGSHTEAACLLLNDIVGHGSADYLASSSETTTPTCPGRRTWPPTASFRPCTCPAVPTRDGSTGPKAMPDATSWGSSCTPTGLKVQASVTGGLYAAWWPAGEPKADNPELTDAPTSLVMLADGSTHETTG
ncbi:MAG: hypothetical protein QOF53_562 [Nocardioidaceae bacterium]|nr:hypothetical protein [Nocardioidaceae bacterium]